MEHSDSVNKTDTVFGLLRHGQTEWNLVKRVQGLEDSPLTDTGRQQTAEWGQTLQRFQFERILGSDLGRVRETVGIINQTLFLPVTVDKRLREQSWGDWEGLTLPHITSRYQEELRRQVAKGWDFTAPGGESRSAVRDRLFAALTDAAARWPGEKILVVCHQGVIKAALYHLTDREFLPGEDPLLHHNSLHLIHCVGDRFRLGELNIPRNPKR